MSPSFVASAISFLFLYTPVPYTIFVSALLYRHDIGRFSHPFRERAEINDWRVVLEDLEIFPSSGSFPEPNAIHILSSCYVVCAALGIAFSVSSSLFLAPLLQPFLLPSVKANFAVYAALQALSAIPWVVAVRRRLGPPPVSPKSRHLSPLRLGSLLKYDTIIGATKQKPEDGSGGKTE